MVYVYLKDASGNTIHYFEIPVPATGVPPSKTFTVANLVPTQAYTLSAGTFGLQNYYGFIGVSWRETRKQNPVPFTVGYAELCVGGLRAKRISHYDNNSSSPSLIKEYEYTMEDGKSSGTLGVYPVYSNVVEYDFRTNTFTSPDYIESYTRRFPFITRSSSSIYALANVNGSPVTYKRVVERSSGNGKYLGRTEHFFTTFSDHPVFIDKPYPFAPPRYSDWKYGLLQRELVYDSNNLLIRKTENSYKYTTDTYYTNPTRFDNFRSVSTAPVKFLYLGNQAGSGYGDFWSNQGPRPLYSLGVNFYPDAGRVDLEKTTTYEYDVTGGILQTTVNYEYDSVNFYLKVQQVVNSKGNTLRKKYNYSKDMLGSVNDPNGVYLAMANSHIINPVIEEIQLKDNVQILQTKTNYSNPYPNVYVPQTNQIKIGGFPIETRIHYHEYSNRGNIRSVSTENGVITSYIWGYKSQYPVAKIVGSDYTTASQYVNQTILDNMSTPDSQMRAELDNIRINLPNAQVITYTYAPLSGMTSETDPSGKATYYEYDTFGRLKLIKDQNGKILKVYDYQYQKPITQ